MKIDSVLTLYNDAHSHITRNKMKIYTHIDQDVFYYSKTLKFIAASFFVFNSKLSPIEIL